MSSKTLVLAVFAVWCLICGYWYVCGVKQVCSPRAAASVPLPNDQTGIEPDTIANANKPEPAPVTSPPASTDEPDLEKVQVEELEDRVVIHFPYNSTRKEDNDAIDEYLSRLARQLTARGGTVTLTGHTDNVGDTRTNDAFAMRRAKNIRDILMAKGVPRKQIVTKSFGERKPVDTNDTRRGRYKNRRVEIRVQ